MPGVADYVAQLRALKAQPSEANVNAVFDVLRQDPDLVRQARPELSVDPFFSAGYRVQQPGAMFQHHNTLMPMPRAIRKPGNLDALLQTVQSAAAEFRTLKAMGDGWGFANAAFTPDWLVQCGEDLDSVLPLEEDLFVAGAPPADALVRFQAGITFDELNAWLTARGRAVVQQPGFGGLTYGGCSAAGGHGGGLSIPGISGQIRAIEIVTLNSANQARLVRIEPENGFLTDDAKWRARYPAPVFDVVKSDSLFHAARCGQGNLGIVYAVTIDTRQAYFLEETRLFTTWGQVWPTCRDVLLSNDPNVHSIHLWINPYLMHDKTDPTVVLTRLTKTTANQRSGQRGWGVLIGGMNPLTEIVRFFMSLFPEMISWAMDGALKSTCANNVIMPSYEALDFGAPNSLPVNAASLGFASADVEKVFPALVKEINAWTAQNQWITSPIGMRWVKKSEDYLSPQFGRDSIMLEVPILKGTPNAVQTLDRYATYMMDTWGARPHWGQQNPMNRAQFAKNYDGAWQQFLPSYRTLNPNGFFDGPLVQQVGLRDLANNH